MGELISAEAQEVQGQPPTHSSSCHSSSFCKGKYISWGFPFHFSTSSFSPANLGHFSLERVEKKEGWVEGGDFYALLGLSLSLFLYVMFFL